MKILLLGSQGMLGHVVKTYFCEKGYDIYCTQRDSEKSDFFFDVCKNLDGINKIINNIKPHVVINCIGILNKAAEDNKAFAVLINSYLPHYLDELSISSNYKFIHVSTDCVFDGMEGNNNESSVPNSQSFYGRSKALGEVINNRSVTLRTSIVGPDINKNGIGLFQWFMSQTGEISGYHKTIWTGVTTMELAKCMEVAIKKDLTVLQHVVNNKKITKYDLLMLFKKYFNKKIIINKDVSHIDDKSLIRTNTSYRFEIPTYEKMISEMRDWVINHKDLYPDLLKGIK